MTASQQAAVPFGRQLAPRVGVCAKTTVTFGSPEGSGIANPEGCIYRRRSSGGKAIDLDGNALQDVKRPRARPTLERSLTLLRELGIEPGCIVDVGAAEDTRSLRVQFPHVHHHLFEPNAALLPGLAANYAAVNHTIYPVAVGNPTLDEFLADVDLPEPCLLKIDVDGPELDVLAGASSTLAKSGVVIVEAPLQYIAARAGYLADRGFSIFDIVDLCYYDDQLWQADLMFLPTATLGLPPFRSLNREPAVPERWYTHGWEHGKWDGAYAS